ncbi:hypothetical protein BaRGS_00028491, partial [Batillaria attramentaria]
EGRTNCASFPCRHGATCTDIGFSYQCACPDGYQGSNCENVRDYCTSNPCFNGGLCVNTDTGTVCNCPPGYRGDRCETVYDLCTVTNPCTVPGSVCTTNSNNRPTCTCPSGYSGDYCQVRTVTCESNTCQNGGTCNDINGQVVCTCVPDLSVNFDLVLRPSSNYMTSELTTFPLNSLALTVSTWVRFTDRTSPGTMLSLYGLNSENSVNNPQQLLHFEKDRVVLSFAGSRTFDFTPPIDDGYWHHVVLSWDGSTGQATLYVDNTVSASTTNYGQGSRLVPVGWLVLGGRYNTTTDTVDRSAGMAGRLSRLHISTEALSSTDVSNLYADFSLVPSGAQRALTKHLLKGAYSAVDYNSQLTLGYCRTQSGCRSIDQVKAQPSVTSCPDDQMVQTARQSPASWTSASFLSSDPVVTNYRRENIGWGDYGVWYAQSDDDGDTAVCSFLLHTRRSSCESPVPPRFGSQSCVTTTSGVRCEPRCSGTNTLSEAGPRYYSCGQYSMYDTSDRVLQFTFPSCTTCQTPLLNLVMSLNFSVNTSPPCSTGQSQLPSNIRSTLNSLNSQWQQGLCGGATCNGVRVEVTCPADASQGIATRTYLEGIEGVLRNFDSSVLRSASEILSIAIADNSDFASTILSSLVITETKTCSSGTVLLGDCCSQYYFSILFLYVGFECGLGHYLDTSTGVCTACALGTYLDVLGETGSSTSSPCKTCPSGLTTPGEGAQSETDCKTNCLFGRYFNYTTGQCELCPVGFYSENPGAFYCEACPFDETTAREGSTARASCSVNPITTSAAPPSTTAATGGPCLITKVKPEEKTGWAIFGETKMKFVTYRLSDLRARNSDKDLLEDSVEEGSVHTNISLQIPVFEEKLNGQVKKKSVHMSDHISEQKTKKKKKRRARRTADLNSQEPAPLRSTASHVQPVPPSTTELPNDGSVRRPLSAFNKPRPTLDDLPYENFVSPRHYNVLEDGGSTSSGLPPRSPSSANRSRIMIDSDEDER